MRKIDTATFVNSFKVKPNKTMSFLLGAGASISSNLPSGGQMVWDFKRSLYCAARQMRTSVYSDLSKENVQREIQSYFDALGGYPELGATDEYSFYFEKCYPTARDREYYIQNMVKDAKPGLGYLCLGKMIIEGKVNLVATTNFDDLVQSGAQSVQPGISIKTISSAISNSVGFSLTEDIPSVIKLHGDYKVDKLKNTETELQRLEEAISTIWGNGISEYGLVVIGYAGNDNSVMSVLEGAVELGKIKKGIYWCVPRGMELSARVSSFMERACELNDQSVVVEIENFDNLMYEVYLGMNLNSVLIDKQWKGSGKKQDILYDNIGKHMSSAVTNALLALQFPRKCYVFNASISTWKELKETVDDTCVAILYARKVWALGSKTGIINAFANKNMGEIEELDIPTYMMKLEDSDIIGMFYKIIEKQLIRRGLIVCDRQKYYDSYTKRTKNGKNVYDAIKVSLSFVDNNVVLNILPTIHVLNSDCTEIDKVEYQSFVNAEMSLLYNTQIHEKIDFWIKRMSSNGRLIFELGNAIFEFNTTRLRFDGIGNINKCYQASEPEVVFDYEREKYATINQLKGLINYGPIEGCANRNIRLAILSPREYARDIWSHLNRLNEHFVTGLKGEKAFLPEYLGFTEVFRCGLDIPNGDNPIRFMGYNLDKVLPLDAKHFFEGLCKYIDKFGINRQEFDVLVIYIPRQLGKMREIKNGKEYFNLHDSLKIYCASKGVVSQIIEERSVHSGNDMAKIAWGLSTALYTKAAGKLWKPKAINYDTAYIGLSYVLSIKSNEKVSIGCSQLFDSEGNGMRLFLRPLKNPQIIQRNPYMRSEDACRLMNNLKRMYDESIPIHKLKRIVIHKTTPFTEEEIEGITKGLPSVEDIELIQIQEFTSWRAIQFQNDLPALFPIQRGTVIPLDKESFLIWTHGSIQHDELAGKNRNYYKNGRGIPAPLLVRRFLGKSPAKDLVNEILMLTKMNWNSGDSLYKVLPVTLDFAKTLSRVAKQDLVVYDKAYDFRYFM